jgi:hypothetical protein
MKTVYHQPIPSREDRATQMRVAEHRAERDAFRELVVTAVSCCTWTLAAYVLVAFAFHTKDKQAGGVLFYGGLAVGYAGNFLTLYFAYNRGRERGDW